MTGSAVQPNPNTPLPPPHKKTKNTHTHTQPDLAPLGLTLLERLYHLLPPPPLDATGKEGPLRCHVPVPPLDALLRTAAAAPAAAPMPMAVVEGEGKEKEDGRVDVWVQVSGGMGYVGRSDVLFVFLFFFVLFFFLFVLIFTFKGGWGLVRLVGS
jgi:hypothetical protein